MVRGDTTKLGFELLLSFVQLTRLAPYQPRHPVHRPQFVQHRATNSRHAIGLELDPTFQIERVNCIQQAKNAGADKVVQFDAVGQSLPDLFAVVANQRHVAFDQAVSQQLPIRRVFRQFLKAGPNLQDILIGCYRRCHPILHDQNRFRFEAHPGHSIFIF